MRNVLYEIYKHFSFTKVSYDQSIECAGFFYWILKRKVMTKVLEDNRVVSDGDILHYSYSVFYI